MTLLRFDTARAASLIAFLVCVPLSGQESGVARAVRPTATPPSAATAAAAGTVILERSAVFILVGKTGLGHDHGVMGRLHDGTIQLGQDANAGQLVFNMASFDADSPLARQYVGLKGETSESARQQVNANMLGKDVLNVAQFPRATFVIQSARPMADSPGSSVARYQLSGNFKLHGVTKPLQLICEATPEKEGLRLRTTFSVLQSDYGMKPYTAALGAVGVANELKIWGDLLIAQANR